MPSAHAHRFVALVAFAALITAGILTASHAPAEVKIRFLASMTAVVCSYGLFQMLLDRAYTVLLARTKRR